MKFERSHIAKIAVLVFYILVIAGVYFYIHWNGVHLRDLPSLISRRVAATGPWGPLVMIGIFAAQTVLPFATIGLNVISGVLFGPWLGTLVVMIGLNVSAAVSFFLGRFLGRHLISENERGWIKKYDDLLTEQGFLTTFTMRVLHFPFDFVSIGAGMTRMTYRQYALGTLLGSAPGAVTFTLLGDAFDSPSSWILFFALLAVTVLITWLVRRSAWAKSHFFKQVEPKDLG